LEEYLEKFSLDFTKTWPAVSRYTSLELDYSEAQSTCGRVDIFDWKFSPAWHCSRATKICQFFFFIVCNNKCL